MSKAKENEMKWRNRKDKTWVHFCVCSQNTYRQTTSGRGVNDRQREKTVSRSKERGGTKRATGGGNHVRSCACVLMKKKLRKGEAPASEVCLFGLGMFPILVLQDPRGYLESKRENPPNPQPPASSHFNFPTHHLSVVILKSGVPPGPNCCCCCCALPPFIPFPFIPNTTLGPIPLPLLGLPPIPELRPPGCCHEGNAYPNGALSLLARLFDLLLAFIVEGGGGGWLSDPAGWVSEAEGMLSVPGL